MLAIFFDKSGDYRLQWEQAAHLFKQRPEPHHPSFPHSMTKLIKDRKSFKTGNKGEGNESIMG
jgi:hypothetical protein